MNDPFELHRFVDAQDAGGTFAAAVSELAGGRKLSHWMWFVLPQVAGLGRSPTAQHFAISGMSEARAYLAHPVLGPRLVQCARILTELPGKDAVFVFGPLDAQKLRSSMTLFAQSGPAHPVFREVLDQYFGGECDAATTAAAKATPATWAAPDLGARGLAGGAGPPPLPVAALWNHLVSDMTAGRERLQDLSQFIPADPLRTPGSCDQSLTMTTPALRYGRRPPKNAPALRLAPLLTGVLPSPPSQVDYGTGFTAWQMLGNDVAGDCVAVTWANQRALVTTALAQKTDYPSQPEVWTLYQTQNPTFDPNGTPSTNGPGSPADGGMDIQSALEYLTNTGGPDGVKAAAFAKVDYTNENELRSAHAIFGQVWYGVNVLAVNQTEFSGGQAWDYVAGSPLDGGHSITGVGYDPSNYRFVTWAQETEWTEAFRAHQVEEAWVVVWPEHLGSTQFEQGINVQQLAADYQEITGQSLVIAPQAPTG